ncbi:hypothetical protein JCM5350_007069 [Sporobolomyces pararoseus]
MEAEPSIASALPPAPLPDSAMTIDYENDPVAGTIGGGGGGDEEMGDQEDSNLPLSSGPPTAEKEDGGAEPEVEEAEMADDEASTWEKDAMVEEGAGTVSEVLPTTTNEQPEEATITDAETLPEVPISTSLAEVASILPVELESSISNEPALDPSATSESALPSTEPVSPIITNGHSQEIDAQPSEVALSEGEQADAEQSDFPEPLKSFEATTASAKQFDQSFDSSTTASPFLRPQVDKALLLGIEVPFPEESSPSNPLAPAVLFTYDNTTYSLFRSHKSVPQSAESGDDASRNGTEGGEEEEELQTLLIDSTDQQLYFGTLEQVFSKLHDQFPELQSREDELVLDFDEIGVALAEDNVYSRQVSLHDFDRIHLGCGLPGRLHARLYAQSRFSSGFNALAQHVANSLNGTGNGTEEGNESEATYDADNGTVNGEEGEEEYIEESFVSVGEPEDVEADGPDSELPTIDQDQEQQDQEQQPQDGEVVGGDEEEEFDLESALAQLDGDDIAAYAEGAAEDYIISEGAERQEGEEENEVPAEGEVIEETPNGEEGSEVKVDERVGGDVSNTGEGCEQVEGVEGEIEQQQIEETSAQDEQNLENAAPEDQAEVTTVEEAALPTESQTEQNVVDAAQDAEDNVEQAQESVAVEPESLAHEGATAPEAPTEGDVKLLASEETATSEVVGESNESSNPTTTETEQAIPEDAVDPNDVVIDYDDAFDGSSSTALPPSTAPEELVPITEAAIKPGEEQAPVVAPHSPKRRHDSLDAGDAGEILQTEIDGSDAKRPRLDQTTADAAA